MLPAELVEAEKKANLYSAARYVFLFLMIIASSFTGATQNWAVGIPVAILFFGAYIVASIKAEQFHNKYMVLFNKEINKYRQI